LSIICVLCLDAYQCDPYSWKNIKKIQYPKTNPEFVKIYYTSLNAEKKKDSRCTKHVYISKKNVFDVLVCYLGKISNLIFRVESHLKRNVDTVIYYALVNKCIENLILR